MNNIKKIVTLIIAIIIIAGIVVTAVFGINKGVDYSDLKQVQIYCATDVNTSEIKSITDEVFGKERVSLQKVELFNDEISITTKSISSEQLEKLNKLINEKYNLENKVENIEIKTIPGANVMDTITPYITPIVISLVVILIYMGIKYRELGFVKSIVKPLGLVILIEALYYSLIAIARIPVNRYTIPFALAILVVTLTTIIYKLEKK